MYDCQYMELNLQHMVSQEMNYIQQFECILWLYIRIYFWSIIVAILFDQVLNQARLFGITIIDISVSFLILCIYYYLSYFCLNICQYHICHLTENHYLFVLYNFRVQLTLYSVWFLILTATSVWKVACLYYLWRHWPTQRSGNKLESRECYSRRLDAIVPFRWHLGAGGHHKFVR